MTAVIVCNGHIEDYTYYKEYLKSAELIICADGGANHIRRFGIKPHILLGDFDSISQDDLKYFKATGTEVIEYPVEKDMTDAELAVECAVERGSKNIILIGVLGTRMDHSLSNVFLLKRILDKGVKGYIVNEYNTITVIKDKILLQREESMRVSLIPLSIQVKGVTTKGLYYPLNRATIDMGSTWGISNEFTGDEAQVTIEDGLLLVIKSRD